MGKLSAAMKAELGRADGQWCDLFSFTLGATTYRYSRTGNHMAGVGLYEPKILERGPVTRGVQQRYNAVEFQTVDLLIDDTDQSFSQIVEGASGNSLRSATAVLQVASPNVASANWHTMFTGRIYSVTQPQPLQWQITLGQNALPLERESCSKGKVEVSDWPNSALDARDAALPLLYGRISSANGANNGAVPCLCVDQVGFRFLVCAGWAKAVDTVYVNGSPVAAADYTITHPIINGRRFTLIDFASAPASNTVTCDAQGYEDVGDGSGALILNPAEMARHILHNHIYGDYRDGAYSTGAPLDSAAFTALASFFTDRGYEASAYVASRRRGQEILNDFLNSFEVKTFWRADGTLAVKVEDFTEFAYVTDLVVYEPQILGWTLRQATENIVDSIDAQWAMTPTGGYQQSLTVKDLRTGESAPESLELPYSPAAFL